MTPRTKSAVLAGLWAGTLQGSAAAQDVVAVRDGLGNFGVSAAIIALASLIILYLLFRGSITRARTWFGKQAGRRRIRGVLRKRSHDILEDFLLPGAYGGLTKIDYAVLTSGGILCIRAKHGNGIVFGGEQEPQWKNVHGVRQRKFLNPAIQNAGRARALQKVLPDVPVANVVVFTGSAQLTLPKMRNVVHVRDLDSYISRFVFGPCRIKDWDAVWLTLKAAAITDEDSRKDFRAELSFS